MKPKPKLTFFCAVYEDSPFPGICAVRKTKAAAIKAAKACEKGFGKYLDHYIAELIVDRTKTI